jgi:hypothetical protein
MKRQHRRLEPPSAGPRRRRPLPLGLALALGGGLACAGPAAPPPDPLPNLARPPLAFHSSPAPARSAQMRADLVRRDAGEWVIVRLEPGEAPAAGPAPAPLQPADEREIRRALDAYERAFEERDASGLSRVWVMNPAERSSVERMFDQGGSISVSISEVAIEVEGDRARLAFEQRFAQARGPQMASRLERLYARALAASDSLGSWALDTLSPRE